MPDSIRSINDNGAVWVHNGEAYYRVTAQPTLGVPDAAIQAGDVINYSDVAFNYDDSNVQNGPDHCTWSACEIAIAKLAAHAKTVGINPYGWFTLPTLPAYPGIVRMWGNTSAGFGLKVGDTTLFENGRTLWSSEANSYALKVMSNAVLQINSQGASTVYMIFLPYQWPRV